MLAGDWLEIGKLNQITIIHDKKRIPVRCTVHQVEQFRALQEKAGTRQEGEKIDMVVDAAELMAVIMNPVPNVEEWGREKILEAFDVDQMRLLTQVWLERKLYSPRIEADPHLGGQVPSRPKA